MESNAKPVRDKVFISYSRDDKRYLQELQDQLALFVRKGQLTVWDDTKIRAGKHWYDEIMQAIASAKVAVFLVSANLLASDFIATEEIPPLIKAEKDKEVTIVPVVLSACLFGESDLSGFHAPHPPSEPLNLLSYGKRQQVWLKIVKEIKKALQEP